MAALVAASDLIDGWETGGRGGAVSSASGHPISCAAALEGIRLLENSGIFDHVKKLGGYMMKRAVELASKHDLVGDVRGKGLLVSFELVKDQKTKKPASNEAEKIIRYAFNNRVLFDLVGSHLHIIRLIPPVTARQRNIDTALEVLDKGLRQQERK